MLIPNLNYNMDEEVSSDEPYDSDKVDSDVEAELYSSIHHEVLLTEPDNTPELNNSLNFISVEENCNVIVKDLNSNSNLNRNLGKGNNRNQMVENKNVSMKRKSNLIANILGTIQVENELPRKKQKTVNCQNKTKGSQSSSGNATIALSDSDSSVILSEPDESLLKLQTNVETLFVSSDSESSVTCLDDKRRFSLNFNFSHSSNSSVNYKDLWKINDTDLYRTKRNSSGRYHENAVSQCTNCKAKGHVAKYCTEARVMKCFVCGGAHMALRCKYRICTKCLRYGHDSRRCSFPHHNLLCNICKMRGHAQKCCPDLWRRYHLTTSTGHIVRGQPYYASAAIYCYNCGLQGHFGFDCNKTRMGRSYPTWPNVVSYEHPSVYGLIGSHVGENDHRATNLPTNPGVYGLIGPRVGEYDHRATNLPTNPGVYGLIGPRVGGNYHRATNLPTNSSVYFGEFQMDSQKIPQMRDPCMVSLRREQKKLFYQARKKERKMMRKKGATKAVLRKVARAKQEAAVSSTVISNSNFQRENVDIKQEINFPRTPKANASPRQCVDEMPRIKKNPKRGKKISQARKERKKQRAMKFFQNCS